MNIGKKIQSARLATDYTQEQAAEILGVSRQTISNWENSKTLPDILSVIKLSDLYGISLDNLLKGDEKMIEKIKKDTNTANSNNILIRVGWASLALAIVLSLTLRYTGNPILEFISAASPWVLTGVGIACIAVSNANKKKEKAE